MNPDLLEQLRDTEETILIELLEVTSTEIVDAFLDKIEDEEERLMGVVYGE